MCRAPTRWLASMRMTPSVGLLAARALVRRLDPVIDGVAEQVPERRVELDEHVAVHLRGLARDLEPHLLAERLGHVADHARKSDDAVGKRSHPAGERSLVQAMRQVD